MLSLIKISYRVLSLESRVANSSVLYVFCTVEVGVIYCTARGIPVNIPTRPGSATVRKEHKNIARGILRAKRTYGE